LTEVLIRRFILAQTRALVVRSRAVHYQREERQQQYGQRAEKQQALPCPELCRTTLLTITPLGVLTNQVEHIYIIVDELYLLLYWKTVGRVLLQHPNYQYNIILHAITFE